MQRIGRTLLGILAAACLAGCGGGGDDTAGEQNADVVAAAGDSAAVAHQQPEKAVQAFLEAVRLGDDQGAVALLTPKARTETERMDMMIAPPGSDTASFRIGEVRDTGPEVAEVDSTWTDVDQSGKPATNEITWVVRNSQDGWRISGMAAKIFPDRPAVMLNFEDPQDMIEQQRLADQEMVRRAQEAQAGGSGEARTAQDPFSQGPQ
ncbi:MAG: hypothetical protein WDZ59_04050 [Pirellulales bacterium]